MGDGHRLVQAMRRAGRTPQNEVVDIVIGEVTSIDPLRVKIENRELTESFLIVGAMCKETHIYTDNVKKLNHTHLIEALTTETSNSHSHLISEHTTIPKVWPEEYDILLWRGLRVGDMVLMIKVGRGQKYYILQRQEGVTPT